MLLDKQEALSKANYACRKWIEQGQGTLNYN